jgi:hypothetical protein
MHGSRRMLVLATVLTSLGTMATTQSASAGTYTVLACSPTTSAGIFQPVNSFPEGLASGNRCGGPAIGPIAFEGPTDEGALFAEDSTKTTANIPNGAQAGWLATAPSGTTISAITYYRSLHAYLQQSLVPGLWGDDGTALESCISPPEGTHECNSLNNQIPVTFTGLDTTSVFFGIRCNLVGGSEYCVPGAPGERHAQADLYSATITLTETSAPTVSSISGAGWSGGVLSGSVPLVVSASDPSGIASIEVRSTLGAVLATAPQSCDDYLAVPCPQLLGATLSLDTAVAPDGPQSLIVTVCDAAGNVTTQTSRPVVVDNHPPAPPPVNPPPPVVVAPPVPPGGGKPKEKLHALLDARGRLYVAGPVPRASPVPCGSAGAQSEASASSDRAA